MRATPPDRPPIDVQLTEFVPVGGFPDVITLEPSLRYFGEPLHCHVTASGGDAYALVVNAEAGGEFPAEPKPIVGVTLQIAGQTVSLNATFAGYRGGKLACAIRLLEQKTKARLSVRAAAPVETEPVNEAAVTHVLVGDPSTGEHDLYWVNISFSGSGLPQSVYDDDGTIAWFPPVDGDHGFGGPVGVITTPPDGP